MSGPRRRLVLWAPPSLLLGVGLRAAVAPLWHTDRPGGPAWLLVLAAVLLLPALLALVLAAGLRRLTAADDGCEAAAGSLRVLPTPAVNALFLPLGYLVANAVVTGAWYGPLILFVVVAGLALVPQLVLTPDHLELRWSGIPPIPWEQLVDAEPVAVGRRRTVRALRLTRSWPGRRPGQETLPLGFAQNPGFVVDAVRHYLAHPEHRPAVGTEAELRRLRAVLRPVGSAAPPVRSRVPRS